ncbi:Ig-like domain-containing protein, partial [Akkermansiaceae bacterium]|nr:Ig-like domain-containing protein [Akkermansiaceae bacterium]
RIGPPDLQDPTLDRVWGNGTTITLDFSEAMNVGLGTNPGNFSLIVDGDALLPISSAEFGASPDTIILTSEIPLDPDGTYTLVVNNLTDLSGRSISGPTSVEFRTWDDNPNGVKVFILAGQSNMQGQGRSEEGFGGVNGATGSLRYQVDNDPGGYGHLVDGLGEWIARDDVKVFYRRSDLNAGSTIKKGNLLPEFGVDDARIGPELGFGWAIGDALDEPVLIVKTCWGGKSLYADFRSPGAVAKRGGEVGDYYIGMFDYVHEVLDNLDTEFPEWAGQGYQIAGFGWHQGWNDGGTEFTATEYETNLADFIRDIRAEFGKPVLPVAIANTGIGGASTTGVRLTLLEGQLAVANPDLYPEFDGNVFAADTRDFWRESSVSPLDQGYHWNQNGETLYLLGEAMGEGMKVLLGE